MQPKKPHQLKTRAVSAIMTSVVNSSSQGLPKKIKPSQSMPLKKKPVVKSPVPAGDQQQPKKDDQPTPSHQGEIYSSSAYINSNITLTKAFRQKGQMASLIPIPASRALTSTKSV